MPAERNNKRSRLTDADEGINLTWTTPVEPTSPQSIAFAPNVTPCTFNQPPTATDLPSSSLLLPLADDAATSRNRKGHGKKKPEDYIPRPPNAFILFRSAFIKNRHVSSEVESNHSTLSKIIGYTWKKLPPHDRQFWEAKAAVAREEHKMKFPGYQFRPLHTKGEGRAPKRRVREASFKDPARCSAIAKLILEGKRGDELAAAVEEFDREHVPSIVTRFEAPITARAYRRSSSAPAPDTECTKEPEFCAPQRPRPRKRRATSTQPGAATRPPSPSPSATVDEPKTPQSEFAYEPETYYEMSEAPSPTSSFSTEINPAFHQDFSGFSFQATTPSDVAGCDPYEQAPVDSAAPLMMPEMQDPCVQYAPHLNVDTSFFADWASTASPMQSIPSTPNSWAMHPSPCDSVSPCETMTPVDTPSAYQNFLPTQVYDPTLYNASYETQPQFWDESQFSNFYGPGLNVDDAQSLQPLCDPNMPPAMQHYAPYVPAGPDTMHPEMDAKSSSELAQGLILDVPSYMTMPTY